MSAKTSDFSVFRTRAALARERFAVMHAARQAQSPITPIIETPIPTPEVKTYVPPVEAIIVADIVPPPAPSPAPEIKTPVAPRHHREKSSAPIEPVLLTIGQAAGTEPKAPVKRPQSAKVSAEIKVIDKQEEEDKQFDNNLDELLGWMYATRDETPKWGCKEVLGLLCHTKEEYELLMFYRQQVLVHSAKICTDIKAKLKKM